MSRAVMQQALEALIENARLLGATQAKHGFGIYTDKDARFERACHESIYKHKTALRAALAEPEQKPSGSFVLWENTLCNPLSDPRSMAHSAWHDGYASGVQAEREACAKMAEAFHRHGYDFTGDAELHEAIRSRT